MTSSNSSPDWRPDVERKQIPLDVKKFASTGEFSGYASLFDRVDLSKDRISRGAFRVSLKARGPAGIRMLFQHDPFEPIGTWQTVAEDARGLFVRGKIAADTQRGGEVLKLLQAGALDGLSIGFKTKSSLTDRKTGVRTIREADLWEISIVTFPMQPQARISDIKQRLRPTTREFEQWLTRDAGLTRREARCVIAKGYSHLSGKRDAAKISNEIVATLRRSTDSLNSTSNK